MSANHLTRRSVLRYASALAPSSMLALPSVARANKLSKDEIIIARPITVLNHAAAIDAALLLKTFEAEGLKVKVSSFRSWSEVTQLVMAEKAVYGLGAATLIRAAVAQKAPVRQLAMVTTLFPYNFWTRGDSGINALADVRGKKIQTVRTGETLDLVWQEILVDADLKMSDVTRIEGFDGFGALASKTVDAANMNDSLFGKAKQLGFKRLLDYNEWRAKKGLQIGGNNLGWGTSLDTLRDHPDTTVAFLRGLAKATDRLRKDKELALKVMTAAPYRMSAEDAEASWELHRSHWIARMDPWAGDFQWDIEKAALALNVPVAQIPTKSVVAAEPMAAALAQTGISFK